MELNAMLLQSARLAQAIHAEYGRIKRDSGARYFTYVLQLKKGTFYVGNTDNIYARLLDHMQCGDSSAKWVKESGGVSRVVEVARNSSRDDEAYKTLQYMSMFGWEKVRGSSYCRVDLCKAPRALETFQRTRDSEFEYLTPAELNMVIAEVMRLYAAGAQMQAETT
jgi:predicted GIY-YIG superfamily endonuclease